MKVSDNITYIMRIMGFDFKKLCSSGFRDEQKGAESQNLEYFIIFTCILRNINVKLLLLLLLLLLL